MQNLSQEEWKEQMAQDEDAVLIDVRTPGEIEMGYIPGALHMDITNAGSFMEQAEKLDKDKNFYLYCRSGSRSAQAGMIMNSLGFNNTYNLEGGFEAWEGEKTSS